MPDQNLNEKYWLASQPISNEYNFTNLWNKNSYTISVIPITVIGYVGPSWTVDKETAEAGKFKYFLNVTLRIN